MTGKAFDDLAGIGVVDEPRAAPFDGPAGLGITDETRAAPFDGPAGLGITGETRAAPFDGPAGLGITGETRAAPFDGPAGLGITGEPRALPIGGLRSLWDTRHTLVASATLPGVSMGNWLIAGWPSAPIGIAVIVIVSLLQVLVIASYLPPRGEAKLVRSRGALPVLAIFAASMLLSELERAISLGAVALTLAATGAVFRFFAGTYEH